MTLIGALFTALAAWALGRLLFARLEIELHRFEHDALAGVCGSALLSVAVFALSAMKLALAPVFAIMGIAAIAAVAAYPKARRIPTARFPPLPPLWRWIFLAPFVCYALLYLSNSLAPEFSPDGSTYHLGIVAQYLRAHGFERITTNMYANLSQGMEMLFLFAFALGGHSAAATVHLAFLFALAVAMLCYARRLGRPRAGVCAALLVYLSPIAGVDGVSAYNDVALAAAGFAMFCLIELWHERNEARLEIPIGLLAGFCFAIKYTGFVAGLYALVMMRRRFARMALAASVVAVPWLVKNWMWMDNPVSPFFNRLFVNPYIHVSFEESYRRYLATYGLPSLWPLPWIVTVTGQLGGQIGPLFLLAPIGLVALRTREGRRCLLGAAFFLLPYPQNIGARFLIPALPFLALGIAMALEFSQAALAAVVAGAALLAWPRVIDRYRAPAGGWQITTMPWQAALRIVPPDTWLSRRFADYRLARAIDQTVPVNKRVWSSMPLAEAYIAPQVLVYYYSAESEKIREMLLTPVREEMQPLWNLRFTFAPRRLRQLRIDQTAASADDIWSVGEARFFDGAKEVRPSRAEAHPFPWDIGLAIDGNPVTRWKAWESIHPGMWIEFGFDSEVELDRVELHSSHDQWKIQLQIHGIDARLEKLEDAPLGDLRKVAVNTVRSHGIDYLMISNDFPAAADMRASPERWGMNVAAKHESGRLYQIR
ncbi:MAG TPA: hypothetical protein VKB79_25535 [Bryobacteraceae bacterium]|nr:hypothetical protein [Bryobacteraceae bacterium]